MIKKAVILAGGLGTRLRSAIGDLPKPMADISGKPFLEYLLDYLIENKITKTILSVGYKSQIIINHFGKKYKSIDIEYSVEDEPLGTGGAIKKALSALEDDKEFFILNGDTFFDVALSKLLEFHIQKNALLTIALKQMTNCKRYGSVLLDSSNRIIGFKEKGSISDSLINGGIYIINKRLFDLIDLPEKFSFEKDLLELYYKKLSFYGKNFNEYFIDIGVPEDYEKFKQEIKAYKSKKT
ncbi:MAG: nucleotidyltransferase family protein [Desulfurella sp.]|uniref:nucleotidyltransferase family protein n=1 Tax=Desulfurella sp. TaxID=1962857 RepID=UPI003D0D681E